MSRLFGTDGIRGVANEPPLTPELAYRVGRQLVATLQANRRMDRVRLVIGRDTRRSGPLLEAALAAGVLSAGGDCYAVGVMPTPAIALLTRGLDADGGIVLSASHNPFQDNGIKLFSAEGTKFPDAWEESIEAGLASPDQCPARPWRRHRPPRDLRPRRALLRGFSLPRLPPGPGRNDGRPGLRARRHLPRRPARLPSAGRKGRRPRRPAGWDEYQCAVGRPASRSAPAQGASGRRRRRVRLRRRRRPSDVGG